MIELRTRLLAGLLLLLAAAPEARPQTAQSGLPTGQVVVRQIGKSGHNGSSRATGTTAGVLPGLCFQPGVGWQRVLTRQPDGSVTRDTITSVEPKEHGSNGGANPPLVSSRLSKRKQAQSVECPEVLTDKKVSGAGVENFTAFSRPLQSTGATNHDTRASLPVHSPYYPNGSLGLGTVRTLPSAIPSAPTDFESEDGPAARSIQMGDRTFHAYLSSIKLRRLIRNTPDLRARIKLQQLQTGLAVPSHHAGTQLAGSTRNGERVSRAASRRSPTPDRPRGTSRSLGVRP